MAEERILIEMLPPASGFGSCGGFYTEGVGEYFCCWNGEKERVTEEICNNCPHDKSMTRQEAIERMAKALCGSNEECIRCPCQGISCRIYLEDEGYMSDAEAALNALLEGK